ncbi:MAG: hypothetical protein ACP59X_20475 [Solidesulfovibrio sp. DCME]|uniref:hypothetical protein n=1 Tax=Solidesulfovibrio sp. DCME TaxID=3447380 RepID=UPI003D1437EB
MANCIYSAFKEGLGSGVFALGSDTLKCALLTGAYTPDTAHAVWADVAAHEASGTGYVSGGAALGGVSWGVSGATAVLDAADPSWLAATVTARYAAVYAAKTAGGRTNPLVCLLDFGADKGVVGGTFSVVFDAAGILVLE